MQDATAVWELLGSLHIGTVVAWIIVISSIISFICFGTIKLYKVFSKYREVKDENDELKNTVKDHDRDLDKLHKEITDMRSELTDELKRINFALNEQRETKIKELRHTIITAGEKAVADKHMTIREWRSLHDVAKEYIEVYKQNSYAKSLVEKVDSDVEIIGKLDEHGYDVYE